MNNPLFSILVAQYNNGHFFKDCFQSILEQTYTNWEVIIVDDFSTDDSIEVIRELIQNDTRFKLFLNDKNYGCGYTKRKCAALATGEICGFLDPDDTLEPIALEKMVAIHLKHLEVSVATSKYMMIDIDLNIILKPNHIKKIPSGCSFLTYGKGAMTHFATFKSSYYAKTFGIDAKFKRAVDQDLYYKLEEVGEHYFLDEFLYNYRINENSISANRNLYKAQYWHHVAMQDAYIRRKKNNDNTIVNFTDFEFKKIEYNYFKSRLQFATSRKRYCSKYYFLLKICCIIPFFQLKYKIRCILFYNFS